MITRDRVVEIFKESVERDPLPKDIMAISSMARNPSITEEVIFETFRGLKEAEDKMAEYRKKEAAKTFKAVVNNKETEVPIAPLSDPEPEDKEDTQPDLPVFPEDEKHPDKEKLESMRFGDLVQVAKIDYGVKVSRGTSKKKLISAILRKIKKLEA